MNSSSVEPHRHVAVIMDGNRRWARLAGYDLARAYEVGARRLYDVVRAATSTHLCSITAFAFSGDNRARPSEERSVLSAAFSASAERFADRLVRDKVRLALLGDLSGISAGAARALRDLETRTRKNEAFVLRLAVGYSGRADIQNAMRAIAQRVAAGTLSVEDISEELFSGATAASSLPDPSLLLRTGGQSRLSDFLLLQLAHAEIAVTDTLWPDLTVGEFLAHVVPR